MNTTEIRSAMVSLAESMGRPYFDGGVVRDVVYAFKSGQYHHLKERVILEMRLLIPSEPAPVLMNSKKPKSTTRKVTPKPKNKLATRGG